MNITELRYLVAIMKWGSVSAAAKQLYAAQPNVSKALKNLEEEYGLRIFERSSTGMIPTEQGKRFIRQAQRVLQQVDRAEAGGAPAAQLRRAAGGADPCHLRLLCGGGFFAAGSPQRAAAGAYPGERCH
ncbi:MAG: LysR family transcriptional regulator [Faecalibacterium prausnitzii]